MKKHSILLKNKSISLIAFMLSAFTAITFTASAQADLSVTLIKPAMAGTVYKSKTDSIVIKVKNTGSMPIMMTDTVVIMVNINSAMVDMYGTMTMMNPGDSQEILIPNFSYTGMTANSDNANFCVDVVVMGSTDPTPTNNNSCHTVKLRLNPAGVSIPESGSKITIYPNPANSFLNIRSEEQMDGQIQLFDITGKVISTTILSGTNISIPTGQYSQGIYFYKLSDKNGVQTENGKILITH